MKITIPTKTLSTLVSRAKPVAGGSLPITQCFLLSAKDGELTLSANNLDLQISTAAPCTVDQPGAVAINASLLSNAVSAIRATELILATDAKNTLEIRAGKSVHKLHGLGIEDFPGGEFKDGKSAIQLTQKRLKEIIAKVAPFMSTEQERFTICSMGLMEQDGKAAFVGTSGRTLRAEWTDQPATIPALLPPPGVSLLKSLLSDSESIVYLEVSETMFSARSGDWFVLGKLIDGSYPNWKQVIPEKGKQTITFDKEEMLGALREAVVTAGKASYSIKFSPGDGKSLYLSGCTADVGESSVEVNGAVAKTKNPVAFNPEYIRQLVDSFEGPEITIHMADEMSPCVAYENNGVAVVMPMRVS